MPMSARYLLDRLRHPRSRANELARLRARFTAQPSRWQAGPLAIEIAEELRRLRVDMHRELGRVELCGSCARGHPLPSGRWNGGHCCGGRTLDIFTAGEVAALKLSGVALRRCQPPRADHAGCAFRGPTGCSLSPVERPTICLRYVCTELRQALKREGRWPAVAVLNRQLRDRFAELVQAIGAEEPAAPVGLSRGVARASSDALRAP